VAQTRERVFIIGFHHDLNVVFTWPEEDPSRPVLRDAIGDVPDPLLGDTGMSNHALHNPRPRSMLNRLRNSGKGMAMFDCKIQAWDQPCQTVTAQLSKDVDLAHPGLPANVAFHSLDPSQPQGNDVARPRRFTVRECARIQSFPDDFIFYGSVSAQYRQVGNAVPPELAYRLALRIAKALHG
jgi:DNA (cytosine-5)-methyltransferase 1